MIQTPEFPLQSSLRPQPCHPQCLLDAWDHRPFTYFQYDTEKGDWLGRTFTSDSGGRSLQAVDTDQARRLRERGAKLHAQRRQLCLEVRASPVAIWDVICVESVQHSSWYFIRSLPCALHPLTPAPFLVVFCLFFETRSSYLARLAWSSWPSCLSLPSHGIAGMLCHTQITMLVFKIRTSVKAVGNCPHSFSFVLFCCFLWIFFSALLVTR